MRQRFRAANREGMLSESQIKQAKREYGYVLSSIKRIRKSDALRADQRRQHIEQKKFKQDPWKYAKELFNPPSAGQPTFTVDGATEYFSKLYIDKGRSEVFEALPGWVRPPQPTTLFNLSTPTLKQLQCAVKKKRNKNAPGLNSIEFVVYRKCPGAQIVVGNYGTSVGIKGNTTVMAVCIGGVDLKV